MNPFHTSMFYLFRFSNTSLDLRSGELAKIRSVVPPLSISQRAKFFISKGKVVTVLKLLALKAYRESKSAKSFYILIS
jgi:hypothetical protein